MRTRSRRDPRLPYQLPGVNKQGKVGNGNYVWISYFDAYLNKNGRAGFVMSSQASSAGGEEARVRRDLIKSGHVEAMIAIRSNFFYTRTVPCELWFLNKAKPPKHRDKVLMIDARGVYRKVTRKIYDFSPEQLKNLSSIVWLYRGEHDRFVSARRGAPGELLLCRGSALGGSGAQHSWSSLLKPRSKSRPSSRHRPTIGRRPPSPNLSQRQRHCGQ